MQKGSQKAREDCKHKQNQGHAHGSTPDNEEPNKWRSPTEGMPAAARLNLRQTSWAPSEVPVNWLTAVNTQQELSCVLHLGILNISYFSFAHLDLHNLPPFTSLQLSHLFQMYELLGSVRCNDLSHLSLHASVPRDFLKLVLNKSFSMKTVSIQKADSVASLFNTLTVLYTNPY